ncbi:hypothetical protein [Microbulbifer aestuariivivens]
MAGSIEWQVESPRWSIGALKSQLREHGAGHETERGSESAGVLLVLFPGYSVRRPWAEQWAEAIAANREGGRLSQVWVFAGPETVFYESRELPVSASLDRLHKGRAFDRILLVAHSSGSFPAHLWLNHWSSRELLAQRYRARIDYVNLDGGSGEGLAGGDLALGEEALALAGNWLAVSVRDSATGSYSANHEDMLALAAKHPQQFAHRLLEAESGCAPAAEWCLHDVPINRRPHNRETFDLERDYTEFGTEHPVNTDWWPIVAE